MKKKSDQIKICTLLLAIIIAFVSCHPPRPSKSRGEDAVTKDTMQVVLTPTVAPNINVYIENSGSMDGYLNGNFEFKDALSFLLTKLPYYYEEKDIKVRLINTKIDSTTITKVDLTNFAKKINVYWADGKKKRGSTTNLNNIFKDILDETNSTTISILFSDCIYSIGIGNVQGLLSIEKNLTMNSFLQKYKKEKIPFATTIVKMNSKFNGRYFPFTGDQYNFQINMERPYYICIIATQELLSDFNKNIPLKKGDIKGFENKYTLVPENVKDVYFSVLTSTYNKGRFKPLRSISNRYFVHGIEDIKLARGGEKLTFAVAVDFSNIQVENDYITNPDNYEITTKNFVIRAIFPINKREIKPNDLAKINNANPTHIIILEANTKAVSNVSFVLKKQMPQWITESNAEDDTDTTQLEGKTFGLKYWVEGIDEAYQTIYPDNKNLFECSIVIK